MPRVHCEAATAGCQAGCLTCLSKEGGRVDGVRQVAFTRHTDSYLLDIGKRAVAFDMAGGEI
jgi:hypothetical protein